MSDRDEIVEVCTRMAVHADRREWDRLGEVFAPSVTLDYTSLNGGEPATLAPADIVGAWSGFLGAFDATQHLVANHLVAVTGDSAVCTASFQATHVLANRFGSPLWTLGGNYEFRLVRLEGVWRIAGVVMTVVWADGNKDLLALAAGGGS
ncbi:MULTISPECIES: nuclear transport factor 2 family protein [unclassified Saccharothrix]|uniref:nuclear transport factor 2 family protein n=1 Tax=unclassified Saccharothrix TaxID=2593673 RepID=UPI00307DC1EE